MISEMELKSIKGGSTKGIVLGVMGALASFIIGVFDGYLRPLRCNAR